MEHPPIRRDTAGFPTRCGTAIKWLLAAGIVATSISACGPSPAPQTVIIAATATANEPAPMLSAGIVQMLHSAGAASSKATAYVVAPGTGQPTIIPLTPRRADGQVDFGPSRDQTLTANVAAVQRAVGQEAAPGAFDLLTTIAGATRVASPPATLIVISSGLSTAGGLDMRQVGWDANPQAVAAQLKAHGLLPELAGYRVMFSGLADTAGRQPALPLPQRTSLVSYWLAICRASGAASCTVDDMTRPDPPAHSTIPVPVVPVPTVTSVRGPSGVSVALPDSLLFSLGSAMLLSSADSVLQPMAEQARNQHLQVSITGHASPDGGTASYNKALSTRRAIAVRNRLLALGLPADQIGTVTGVGTAGESPSACLVQGQLDEAICGQMRRVVVLLSTNVASQ
jgi:outer membrane protein OmpA-like peptidoglycan-associated protein